MDVASLQIADLCNKGAGKIGDLVHLETIWKKLHFGQLKVSHDFATPSVVERYVCE